MGSPEFRQETSSISLAAKGSAEAFSKHTITKLQRFASRFGRLLPNLEDARLLCMEVLLRMELTILYLVSTNYDLESARQHWLRA
jgi:hypothetical protein